MKVTVGTFNLNNLFSRYNFRANISSITGTQLSSTVTYTFTDPKTYVMRKYMGKLVKPKPEDERRLIADRIKAMDIDILAVQEVEDIDILRNFVRDDLNGIYQYQVLVEGNDKRLIDIGFLSKYPIGAITSWQKAVHPDISFAPVFGRDMLEVEFYNTKRTKKLFTIYNNHLKSHYVPYNQEQTEGHKRANDRRKRQAEMVAQIVIAQMRPQSSYIILGDMNDPPNSKYLAPFAKNTELKLVNALTDPIEVLQKKKKAGLPDKTAWTHRFKPSGKPAEYELYDQIWLSPSLADKQAGAWVGRRTKLSGDGSDHDPVWIELEV